SLNCRSGKVRIVAKASRQLSAADKERQMRVVVFVKATGDSEAEIMPEAQMLEEMGRYNEQLVDAGIMLGGDGLKPSKYGKRVAFSGVGRSVIDGPFGETKELVAGYWIWEVRDME